MSHKVMLVTIVVNSVENGPIDLFRFSQKAIVSLCQMTVSTKPMHFVHTSTVPGTSTRVPLFGSEVPFWYKYLY
jgi:hypothetical protein